LRRGRLTLEKCAAGVRLKYGPDAVRAVFHRGTRDAAQSGSPPGGDAMKRTLMTLLGALVSSWLAATTQAPPPPASTPDASGVPAAKRTSLGLYLTAREAYEKWKADPARVQILDVRTPEEYLFVGHAEPAWNVPLMFQTYAWDASGRNLAMSPNPDFLTRVRELFKPDETILVMCRSGGRSARAVDLLAGAGFSHVYSIVDGMEGDAVDDPASPLVGKRAKNGWKNAGLPWTYDLDPGKMSLPAARPDAPPAKK
jgi:rhodanese-related sulfurtransferase